MAQLDNQDEPLVCVTPGCGGNRVRWRTRHGTFAYHPHCSRCLSSAGKTGGRGNRKIPRRIVLTEDINHCFYCGLIATEEDHVIPRSALRGLPLSLQREVVVPSCRECNAVLHNLFTVTLVDRKDKLREKLRRRYAKLLASPGWELEEIKDLDGSLRKHVEACERQRAEVQLRLAYEAPTRHYELMRAEYEQYRFWLEQLGMEL